MIRRRQVLQGAGAAAVGAMMLRGRRAFGQTAAEGTPTYFIEICLRDQLDFGHVFVAPGLAKNGNLIRGENGRKAALFYPSSELVAMPNDVFLTPQSDVLKPHVDTIAMMELCQLTEGPVHGHEAANPVRSPGRTTQQGGGRVAMWQGEPGSSSGEGAFYSSTPTPASLHNYWQKKVTPGLRNAVAIKGVDRPGAIYHFGAGMAGAELDRIQTVDSLLKAFPATIGADTNILKSPEEANLVAALLKRADQRFLASRGGSQALHDNHLAQLSEAHGLVYQGAPKQFSLPLTVEERAFWSAGVPARYGRTTIDIWEQAAYAFKLISADVVRTVALEVDIGDVHGERTQSQMTKQTLIVTVTLARLIEQLKAAGLYDRTLIAIYTSDGGRAPAAGSSGDEGRNGAILAGGMIRGGYYGDIRADGAHNDGQYYRYFMPDLTTGAPIADGTRGDDKRVPGSYLWRTVAKALQIPDALASSFPDVAGGKPLPFLLRA